MAGNEVKILVRVYNSGKAGLDEVNKDVDDYAKKFSETFTKRFSESMTQNLDQNLTQHIRTVVDQAGRDIGDRMGNSVGERMTTRITERLRTVRDRMTSSSSSSSARSDGGGGGDRDRVHVSVDVDQKTLTERLGDLGKNLSEKVSGFFQDGLKGGLTSIFSGDVFSTILKAGLIGLGTTVIAPALGAAISSGVLLALGGGFLGAGLLAAFQGPEIGGALKKGGAFNAFKAEVKKEFLDFGVNFIGPIQHFAEGLVGVFRQLKPMIDHLGTALGPVADDLASGVIGFLQNVMPAILRGVEASAPLIRVLADNLPGIGDAMGRFFDHISQSGPQAATFLNDLLHALQLLIRFLGVFIAGLTQMYIFARRVFVGLVSVILNSAALILEGMTAAFGWIPGIGPKLRHAEESFGNFAAGVMHKLREIPRDIPVTIRLRVVGQAAANAAIRTARILAGMRAAGGVGHAAEGGPRSNLTWVGEHGPELVDLPPGSTVHTAGDSARMAASGGGTQRLDIRLTADRTTERGVIDALFRVFRAEIGDNYGGNVQLALGR